MIAPLLDRICAALGAQRVQAYDRARIDRDGPRTQGEIDTISELRKLADKLERRVK